MRLAAFLALTPIIVLAASAPAQTRYAPGRDTLRFREVTRSETRLTAPQGEIAVGSEHVAVVAFARTTGDTARAWYDSLTLVSTGPMGEQRPATDPLLRAPFVMTFDARGHVKVIAAPEFPPTIRQLTDLTRQFDDFFLRLPREPLRMGLTWSDTTERSDSTAERFSRSRSIATYRVERDTVVAGVAAVVISMRQQIRSSTEAPVPNQPLRANVQLEGLDDGIVVFAPNPGRLIGRRRTGTLQGDLVMSGSAGALTLKQASTYTNTLDAIR